MKTFHLTLILAFAALLASCQKSPKEMDAPVVNPVKRNTGGTTGPAVSKTIGSDGGTLQATGVQLVIPAGAVSEPVNFSIQPVENTLTGSSRPAFRFLPEHIAFKKPVRIVLEYDASETAGTTPDLLHLAYQDPEGFFHMVMETERNVTARTLTALTTHFSDWTYVEALKIEADRTELKTGEQAQLKLMYYETLISPLEKDPPLGQYVDYYIRSQIPHIQWKLAVGEGTIKPDGINCLFTAPGAPPAVNPSLVSVYVPVWNSVKKDYSKQAILTIPLTVVEDEYLMYTLDGTTHINKKDCGPEDCISMEADNFYINAEMSGGQYIRIRLLGESFGQRSYPYGLEDDQGYIIVAGMGEYDWATSKFPCPTCDEQHSSGSVTVTRYEAVGGYVEGKFTAEIWYQNGSYNPPKKQLSGQFRIRRKT
ncbi:hypothetical protein [Chitinophaga lutea]|nr:hypothetical protein [Chitinophaga lutea]